MTAATHPTPPAWVPLLDVDRLRLELGRGTVDRGEAYHRQGRVLRYAVTEQGTVVTAAVAGSRGRPYTSTIALDWPEEETADALAGLEPDELEWSCSCTCPMGGDCKHVVATILALTGAAPTTRHTAQGPEAARRAEWQALLDPIVRAAPTAGATTANPDDALGLLVEVSLARQRAGQAEAAPSLRLRPVARGSNGNWVRTGISWHDLEYGARAGRADPAQRAAIRAFQLAERALSTHYYSSYSSQTLDPGELGPTLWRLLDDAIAAGVAIVTGQRGQLPVHVTTEPLDPQLDLSRTPDGDVLVVADVAVPGTDGPLQFIGSPPHGGFVQTGAGLTLARFASPLSPALADLVRRHGEIIIPAPDVDRFLTSYSPTLRRLASVGSHDGSVVLPEVRPPRLALRVATLGDHRLRLHWSLGYSVGDGVIDVPLLRHAPATGDSTDPVPRDPGAEEALLSGIVALDELGAVAGLRVPKPGLSRLALVLEPDLAGMDTVVFLRDVLPVLKARDDVDVTVVGELLTYVESTATPVVAVSASDPGDPSDPAGTAPGRARVGDHGDADGPQLDWFDLGIDVSVDGRSVPLSRLLQALAADETHLILDDGTWFSLDVPTLHSLRRIVDEARTLQDRPSDGLKINRFQAGLWAELVELGVVAHQGERWSRAVGPCSGSAPCPDPVPGGAPRRPAALPARGLPLVSLLWDHRARRHPRRRHGPGQDAAGRSRHGADGPRSAGALTPDAPLLVVAPTSVVSTWAAARPRASRPGCAVVAMTETRDERTRVADERPRAHTSSSRPTRCFRIDEDAFRTCAWAGLVLDEAQFVKNHQAKAYQLPARLPAPFKLAITGTPLENTLMDLWALLSIVAPGLFPVPTAFGDLYRQPDRDAATTPELLDTLRRRIRPLMLRRTKEQVAPDLPPKQEQVLEVELDPRHRQDLRPHLAARAAEDPRACSTTSTATASPSSVADPAAPAQPRPVPWSTRTLPACARRASSTRCSSSSRGWRRRATGRWSSASSPASSRIVRERLDEAGIELRATSTAAPATAPSGSPLSSTATRRCS